MQFADCIIAINPINPTCTTSHNPIAGTNTTPGTSGVHILPNAKIPPTPSAEYPPLKVNVRLGHVGFGGGITSISSNLLNISVKSDCLG
jgi:hypothetical protein